MSGPKASKFQGHIGSLLTSALFVLIGFVTIYDAASYTDRDSQVFPQTVAIILIIIAIAMTMNITIALSPGRSQRVES